MKPLDSKTKDGSTSVDYIYCRCRCFCFCSCNCAPGLAESWSETIFNAMLWNAAESIGGNIYRIMW